MKKDDGSLVLISSDSMRFWSGDSSTIFGASSQRLIRRRMVSSSADRVTKFCQSGVISLLNYDYHKALLA